MSTVKISELPVLSSADAADEFVVVDDSAGVTKKITFDSLATDVRSESEPLTASTVSASGLVTASAGITFDSDTLDDYEEGTWTPVLADKSTGGNTATASFTNGKYIKIGNLVNLLVELREINTSGLSGTAWVRTFPFPVVGPGIFAWPAGASNISFSGFIYGLTSVTGGTSSKCRIFESSGSGGHNSLNISDFTSGSAELFLTLTYRTS